MSNERVSFIVDLYESSFKRSKDVMAKVPESARLRQAQPNKSHPLWLVGHLTMTNELLIGNWVLDRDLTIPAEWTRTFAPTFAGGAPIESDPSAYPDWDTMVAAYSETGAALVAAIRELTDEQLYEDARGPMPEQFREGFGKIGQALVQMALHDAHHRGQMALLGELEG